MAAILSTTGHTANPATKEYVDAQVTILQSQIAAIPSGNQGPAGPQGPEGDPGPGVAAGGTTGQILAKATDTDYDTEWVDGPATYTIGQQAMGGVVFYVDATGQHGLIAANADNNGVLAIRWGIGQQTLATGDGIGAGSMNTSLAIAKQASEADVANDALLICANYAIQADGVTPCAAPGAAGATCYADWYLPSKFELNQLYLQKVAGTVGGFANVDYWSSTETGAANAWVQNFGSGNQLFDSKIANLRVRCVRAF
ncbi:Lcl C-terminal domain-containing protein [Legionella impletisoli]|uniref:Lcl C-terminal domain-containing protein n=1 Tax=Legionella impletisoli TaxID=343510 RepID=UPI0013EFAC20|nr:DUF1566 domain-containing protein [Legionella impletisoli]